MRLETAEQAREREDVAAHDDAGEAAREREERDHQNRQAYQDLLSPGATNDQENPIKDVSHHEDVDQGHQHCLE